MEAVNLNKTRRRLQLHQSDFHHETFTMRSNIFTRRGCPKPWDDAWNCEMMREDSQWNHQSWQFWVQNATALISNSTVWYRTVQFYIALYNIVQYYTVLMSAVLYSYSTSQFCISCTELISIVRWAGSIQIFFLVKYSPSDGSEVTHVSYLVLVSMKSRSYIRPYILSRDYLEDNVGVWVG